MSIRAYKLIEIKTEKTPSFSVSHDNWVLDTLNLWDNLNDGCGVITIRDLDIKALRRRSKGNLERQEVVKQIEKDLASADDDYVEYFCY